MKFIVLAILAPVISFPSSYLAAAKANTITGSASAARCGAVCTGGLNVQNLGGPGNGTLQFNGVSTSQTGTYAATVSYDNGSSGDLPAAVSVNGAAPITLHFPSTGSWSTLKSAPVNLPLKTGSNTVRVSSVSNHNWIAEICQLIIPDHPIFVTPSGSISLQPSSLAFPNTNVGNSSATRTVTLQNTGTTTVTLSGINVSAGYSQTNNCPSTLPGNGTCSISVVFSPTATGSVNGTLTASATGTVPQSVSLTGTASPTSAYSYVNSGHHGLSTSGNQVYALPWTSVAGDAVVVAVDCYGGASCAVGPVNDSSGNAYTQLVTTVAGSNTRASLFCSNVSSVGSGLTITTQLTQAAAGDSDMTVAEYAGVSCTPDVTPASGTGSGSSNFSAGPITTTNAQDLLVGLGTSSQGTPPTAGTGFVMRQNSSGQENYGYEDQVVTSTGTRSFTESTSVNTTWAMVGASLPITGTVSASPNVAFSPTSLTFGSQNTGTSSTSQSVTLTNSGTATLSISSIVASSSYAQTNTCGSTLAASASCAISVTFSPSAAGSLSGSITVTDNAAGSPHLVPLSGTGTTPVGGGGGTFSPDNNAVTLSVVSGCGSAGTGGNDTTCLQNAANYSASNGVQVRIASGNYNVSNLRLQSNTNIFLDSGATIQVTSGIGSGDHIVDVIQANNVTVKGASASTAIIKGRKTEYTDGSEYRHCFNINASNTVTVTGISCNDSGGDGFYVSGYGSGAALSTYVTLQNITSNNNSRNGISIISVNHLLVDSATITNTNQNGSGGSAPDGPWDGIDFEPNGPTDHLENITISNSYIGYNGVPCPAGVCTGRAHGGNGIGGTIGNLSSASATVGVTINNVTTEHNQGSGFLWYGDSASAVPGAINIQNSTSKNDGQWGIELYFWDYWSGGTVLTATNNTVINPQQGWTATAPDNAAFGYTNGGGANSNPGNFVINGLAVQWTGNNLAFDINPANPGNLQHVSISGVTVTGITSNPFGYVKGYGNVNSITIP